MQPTTMYLHKLICLNLMKLTFLDSSLQNLSDDIKFDWFLRWLHFSIVCGNDIISCYKVFKFAYFVELTKGYQPQKCQCCRLCGSSFIEGLQKHTDDVIMMLFHIFGIQNFHIL